MRLANARSESAADGFEDIGVAPMVNNVFACSVGSARCKQIRQVAMDVWLAGPIARRGPEEPQSAAKSCRE